MCLAHKKRQEKMWRLSICGKDDIKKFQGNINFLHPEKKNETAEGD